MSIYGSVGVFIHDGAVGVSIYGDGVLMYGGVVGALIHSGVVGVY